MRTLCLKDVLWKTNLRSISTRLSSVAERSIYNQMFAFFDPILSISECGSRQDYNMETFLFVMIGKWEKALIIVVLVEL